MKKQCAAIAAAMTFAATVQAGEGYSVFAGADFIQHTVSLTRATPAPESENGATLGATERLDGDGSSVRLRAGMWLGEDFAVEVQGSVSGDSVAGPDTAEVESYFGAFISPRAQLTDWLDVLFPIGFASVDASIPRAVTDDNGNVTGYTSVSSSNTGVAYGVNMQFRLGELLGDEDSILAGLGIGAGFMVYNSSDNVNVRGYNAGVHFGYDF